MIDSFQLGQTVALKDGRQAIIRFLGSTHFADGEWIGIELEDQSGKNDGSVQGNRYFDCDMGHGMFLREAGIARVVEQPGPAASKQVHDRANGHPAQPSRARPSSTISNGLKRTSNVDAVAKRQSMNMPSPTPGARNAGPLSGLRVALSHDIY